MRAIQEVQSLPANWDSYGSEPVDSRSVSQAFELVLFLASLGAPAPSITASPSGNIIFHWRSARHTLEIEIAPGFNEYVLLDRADESEDSWLHLRVGRD